MLSSLYFYQTLVSIRKHLTDPTEWVLRSMPKNINPLNPFKYNSVSIVEIICIVSYLFLGCNESPIGTSLCYGVHRDDLLLHSTTRDPVGFAQLCLCLTVSSHTLSKSRAVVSEQKMWECRLRFRLVRDVMWPCVKRREGSLQLSHIDFLKEIRSFVQQIYETKNWKKSVNECQIKWSLYCWWHMRKVRWVEIVATRALCFICTFHMFGIYFVFLLLSLLFSARYVY